MSADSGLATFRDSGGLWEGHDIEDVATIHGWERDPEKFFHFTINEGNKLTRQPQMRATKLWLNSKLLCYKYHHAKCG